MKASRFLLFAGAALISLLPFLTRAAQDGALPVTPGAGQYLPDAEAIGDGWVSIIEVGIAPGPELFEEGVKAVYGGPEGSCAVVYAWITREGEETTRRSWQTTAEFMGSARAEWGSQFPEDRENELVLPPPPDGCIEATRSEGAAGSTTIPVGLTLCAIDPDVIVMTIVSGSLDGETGYLASDALLTRVMGDG